jgi:branched-chain amino acid transport system ATP-binding protein
MNDALLEVDDVHVRYGVIPALRGVSLAVRPGEMVALLGANGAGKSTTLRTVSGLCRPYGGEVRFMGERIDGLAPAKVVGRGIAQLPEGRDLFPGLTVRENLRYGYWPRRRDRAAFAGQLDYVYDCFPRLRERSSQKAGTLSGGEQQMLGVGIALMSKPRLLLIDELSLGLAPRVVTQLFDILRRVNTEGTTILLVEQFVPLALANTDRALVLAKGEVALAGPSADLATDPALLASYLGAGAATNEPPSRGVPEIDRTVGTSPAHLPADRSHPSPQDQEVVTG